MIVGTYKGRTLFEGVDGRYYHLEEDCRCGHMKDIPVVWLYEKFLKLTEVEK